MPKPVPAPLPENFLSLARDAQWEIFKHLSPADLNALKRTSSYAADVVQAYQDHQENVFAAKCADLARFLSRLGLG